MSNRTILRLTKEYNSIQKNPIPNAIIVPENDNWLIWHFVMHGLEGLYSKGVYYGEIRFPINYPMGPPSIIMHTPSGRFSPGEKICVSMSSFHPETWTPSWNISSIVLAMISYMYDDDQGVGTVLSTPQEKIQLALMSFEENKKNPKFLKHFHDYLDVLTPIVPFVPFVPPVTNTSISQKNRIKTVIIWCISFSIPIMLFILLYIYYYYH